MPGRPAQAMGARIFWIASAASWGVLRSRLVQRRKALLQGRNFWGCWRFASSQSSVAAHSAFGSRRPGISLAPQTHGTRCCRPTQAAAVCGA